MKKIYVLTVVCLSFAVAGWSQTYWVGPANGTGKWGNTANWSTSSGGAGGAAIPTIGTNVIINSDGGLFLDVDASINSLKVTNTSDFTITSSDIALPASRTLTVNGTGTGASAALQVDAGSRLEDSTIAGTTFEFIFAADTKGEVNGDWYLTGNTIDDYSTFTLPQGSGQSTKLNINNNASITLTGNAFASINTNPLAIPYLSFNAGSFLHLSGDGTIVPKALYNATSTISITGITNVGPTIEEKNFLGNLIYNCPDQADFMSLSLQGGIKIRGNFQILSTNNQRLTLMDNQVSLAQPDEVEIGGNLDISGNSVVKLSSKNVFDNAYILTVDGNVTTGGTSFDIQSSSDFSSNLATTLVIKGNLQHTAGTFGATSTSVNESADIFVVEMNGATAQTISSVTGSIDNAAHQVTLRMNNASGVSLLTPLKVGRIDFSSAGKGVLQTTSTNVLTVQNTSANNRVINSPSDLGYVSGPVRRASASTSTDPIVFPTGIGGKFRKLVITPVSGPATVYEANLIAGIHPDPKTTPLTNLAAYYWDISRFSGTADATVQLTLRDAVPGALAEDQLVVAKHSGASWVSAKGTTGNAITPGNATSGDVYSELQSSFNLFTVAYISNGALPINLLSFAGRRTGSNAELSWKISENSTPVSFDVMRSADGKNFVAAGSVSVLGGQLNYSFTDQGLPAGNNFYRLKMYDIDGAVSFSNIIVIMNGSKGVLISSMIPTLVRDRARLNISSSIKGNMQLVVTDINGRVMHNQIVPISTGNQEVWLNAGNLSAGMFQVTGYINGEKTVTIRFIKQ